MVRVRVAASKDASFLEAALNRHLGGPRERRRSFRSILIYAIESLESHCYVVGLKAKTAQREGGDAVSLAEQAKEHVLRADVVCPHSCGMIAGDAEGMPGTFGEQQHPAQASYGAAAATG